MTLQQKQAVFSQFVARLIQQALVMGMEVTLGEAWRPPEMAQIYAKDGRGIEDSNHEIRLAIDLNIVSAGKLVTNVGGYQPLGEWWEKQSNGEIICAWGGRFKRVDAFHFSFLHNGIK